jgi:hypothetical protein
VKGVRGRVQRAERLLEAGTTGFAVAVDDQQPPPGDIDESDRPSARHADGSLEDGIRPLDGLARCGGDPVAIRTFRGRPFEDARTLSLVHLTASGQSPGEGSLRHSGRSRTVPECTNVDAGAATSQPAP